MNAILGLILHAIGGWAAATFYVPYRKVRGWSWETYWLCQGFVSWIVMPIFISLLTIPHLWQVISASPAKSLAWSYIFGVLWGIGGLTFGLSMRYLGLSLGYALALGFCAMFGTLIPPIYAGDAVSLFSTASGLAVLAGVAICLAGISVCGYAGVLKERELDEAAKRQAIKEFALTKGIAVAVFAGVMSAFMAFGLQVGKPIADQVLESGARTLWQYNPVYILIMAGGFTTNCVWCLILNIKNKTLREYGKVSGSEGKLLANYLWASLGGATWYMQFFFYGMGATKLGREYDFASWTIHMAFIIVFSNFWGLVFREWRGTTSKTRLVIAAGIVALILSTLVVGYGSYLKM
jgi:L-rhamnose-H+ transport protein